MRQREIDVLFLSSEPYPFGDRERTQLQEMTSARKVVLVDGKTFSWFGSPMLEGFQNLQRILTSI